MLQGGETFNPASYLLLSTTSPRLVSSSHQLAYLVVELCAKVGALNPRIKETRSIEIWWWPLSQVPLSQV